MGRRFDASVQKNLGHRHHCSGVKSDLTSLKSYPFPASPCTERGDRFRVRRRRVSRSPALPLLQQLVPADSNMKVSVAALAFVLSMACCSQASIEEKNFEMSWRIPPTCCFSYISRQIPRRFVVDYFVTSSLCSQPAVV
ncbi:uncharacterized protein LOC101943654 isoform X2 [Chrysemys picta bellii]|uniref:uncharacterized protein LOC101943654 isoform X2 n=1 Tax=Chrysemys picta bellii TaxID=8478 RepID=UPI0032B29839